MFPWLLLPYLLYCPRLGHQGTPSLFLLGPTTSHLPWHCCSAVWKWYLEQ